MIKSFGNKLTEHIFHGTSSKEVRGFPSTLVSKAINKLDMINAAYSLDDLKIPPHNHLKKLQGDLQEFYSIRINDQFRIIFIWNNGDAEKVSIIDYH